MKRRRRLRDARRFTGPAETLVAIATLVGRAASRFPNALLGKPALQ